MTSDRATPAPARLEQCGQIEDWFITQGVPHFAANYSSRSRQPLLVYILFTVLAFQVGVAPWLELGAPQLLVAPLILFLLSLWIVPAIPSVLGLNTGANARWWSLPGRLIALGIAAYLLARSDLPPVWSDPWIDFAVVFGVLASSALLFQQQVWTADGRPAKNQRRGILATVIVAIVLFALEGSVFNPFWLVMHDAGLGPMPQALPALVVVLLILLMSLRLTRSTEGSEGVDPADPMAGVLITMVPLLVLVLGAETAVLPHAAPDGAVQAVPLLLLLVVGAVSGLIWWQESRQRRWARLQGPTQKARAALASRVVGSVWVILFLLSYPVLAGLYFEINAFGETLRGFDAFALAFAINALYLGIAWFVVSFGLDHVGAWTYRTIFDDLRGIAVGLVRGLPLLLVFAAFLVLQAELWQVVVEIDTLAYVVLLSLPTVFALSLMAITSIERVNRQARFSHWRDVLSAALHTNGRVGAESERQVHDWLRLVDRNPEDRAPKPELSWRERANVSIVLIAYQSLILGPVAIAAAALFWGFGKLAVTPEVAADWVYGDKSPPSLGDDLANLQFLDEPWTRVAGLLAVISLLYLAVTVLASSEQRQQFFDAAERGIGKRLAVRVVYREIRAPQTPRSRGLASLLARWRPADR